MSKYLVILHDAQDSSQVGREELKLRLSDELGVTEAVVVRLLDSLPVILRRDLDFAVAKRYADTLESLGAVVEAIEQVDGVTDELLGASAAFFQADKGELEKPETAPSKTPLPDTTELTLAPEVSEADNDLSLLEDLLENALHDSSFSSDALGEPTPEPPMQESLKRESGALVLRFENEPDPPEAEISAVAPEAVRNEMLHQMMLADAPAPTDETVQAPRQDPEPDAPPTEVNLAAAFQKSAEAQPNEFIFPPVKKKNKKKLALIAAGMLLAPMPLLLFSRSSPMSVISIDVESLLKQQKLILEGQPPVVMVDKQITGQWLGESNDARGVSRVRILELDKEMAFGKLEVSTPEPPLLSAKEIGAGISRIWLKKFEATNLKRVEDNEGDIVFRGQGRAFTEENTKSERVLADAELRVTKAAVTESEISVRWSLSRNHQAAGEPVSKRLPKGDLELFFIGSTPVKKQAPEAPREPKPARAAVPHPKAEK